MIDELISITLARYSEGQISLVNKKGGCYLVHPTPHDFQYEYTGESYIV